MCACFIFPPWISLVFEITALTQDAESLMNKLSLDYLSVPQLVRKSMLFYSP